MLYYTYYFYFLPLFSFIPPSTMSKLSPPSRSIFLVTKHFGLKLRLLKILVLRPWPHPKPQTETVFGDRAFKGGDSVKMRPLGYDNSIWPMSLQEEEIWTYRHQGAHRQRKDHMKTQWKATKCKARKRLYKKPNQTKHLHLGCFRLQNYEKYISVV